MIMELIIKVVILILTDDDDDDIILMIMTIILMITKKLYIIKLMISISLPVFSYNHLLSRKNEA